MQEQIEPEHHVAQNPQVNEETLLAGGYKEFPHVGLQAFQKVVREPGAKRYFLNAFILYMDGASLVTFEVILFRADESEFRVKIPVEPKTTIEGVEAFVTEMYEKLGCIPDIHNN